MAENQNSSAQVHKCLHANWRSPPVVPVWWGFGGTGAVWGGFGETGLEVAEAAWISHHSRDPALPIQRHHWLSWPWGICRVCWKFTPQPYCLWGKTKPWTKCKGHICTGLEKNFISHSLYQFKTRKSRSLLALVFWIGRTVLFERHHWKDIHIDLYTYTHTRYIHLYMYIHTHYIHFKYVYIYNL